MYTVYTQWQVQAWLTYKFLQKEMDCSYFCSLERLRDMGFYHQYVILWGIFLVIKGSIIAWREPSFFTIGQAVSYFLKCLLHAIHGPTVMTSEIDWSHLRPYCLLPMLQYDSAQDSQLRNLFFSREKNATYKCQLNIFCAWSSWSATTLETQTICQLQFSIHLWRYV